MQRLPSPSESSPVALRAPTTFAVRHAVTCFGLVDRGMKRREANCSPSPQIGLASSSFELGRASPVGCRSPILIQGGLGKIQDCASEGRRQSMPVHDKLAKRLVFPTPFRQGHIVVFGSCFCKSSCAVSIGGAITLFCASANRCNRLSLNDMRRPCDLQLSERRALCPRPLRTSGAGGVVECHFVRLPDRLCESAFPEMMGRERGVRLTSVRRTESRKTQQRQSTVLDYLRVTTPRGCHERVDETYPRSLGRSRTRSGLFPQMPDQFDHLLWLHFRVLTLRSDEFGGRLHFDCPPRLNRDLRITGPCEPFDLARPSIPFHGHE